MIDINVTQLIRPWNEQVVGFHPTYTTNSKSKISKFSCILSFRVVLGITITFSWIKNLSAICAVVLLYFWLIDINHIFAITLLQFQNYFDYFVYNALIAFRTAIIITPTSANIANHIFAIPNAPKIKHIALIPSASIIFW